MNGNATLEHRDVIIIGAGISGLGAACHLQRECPKKDYVILEARDAIGGTWDLFRYPGIRSDSDLYTYGYDFKPWYGQPIATAATIVPAVVERVAHVTQLQRSPSYYLPVDNREEDDMIKELRSLDVPQEWIHGIKRRKFLEYGRVFTGRALNEPEVVRQELLDMVAAVLPEDYDIRTHFTPRLRPEDQAMEAKPFIDSADFAPGYMRRGTGRLPKQGDREPWINIQNYYMEKDALPEVSFDDGVLQFENPMPAGDPFRCV